MKKILAFIAAASASAFLINSAPPTEAAEISAYRQPIGSRQYIVQRGDTVYKICNLLHISAKDLIKMNPVLKKDNGAKIYTSQALELPQEESMSGYEAQVLQLTNNERAKAGLQPLLDNYSQLNKSARVKAEDMAHNNYFSHTSPTYGSPFQQMRTMGVQYTAAGENIAKGQKTPQEVVTAWMNSAGHRANILNPKFSHMGVGYEASAKCWVQQFTAQ